MKDTLYFSGKARFPPRNQHSEYRWYLQNKVSLTECQLLPAHLSATTLNKLSVTEEATETLCSSQLNLCSEPFGTRMLTVQLQHRLFNVCTFFVVPHVPYIFLFSLLRHGSSRITHLALQLGEFYTASFHNKWLTKLLKM